MKIYAVFVFLLGISTVSTQLVYAVRIHTHAKATYVALRTGAAPNIRFSLAYRDTGNGPSSSERLYLMREPDHTLLQVVPDVESFGCAYDVYWSPNSRAVVVLYRSDLNHWKMNLYRVQNNRLVRVHGLDMLDTVAKNAGLSAHTIRENEHACHFTIQWQNASQFVVGQEEMFYSSLPRPAQLLGQYAELYARPTPYDAGDEKYIITVSIKAVCRLCDTEGKAQIVLLKPGSFHH